MINYIAQAFILLVQIVSVWSEVLEVKSKQY